LNTDSDKADVTSLGRPFHTFVLATGKARPPILDRLQVTYPTLLKRKFGIFKNKGTSIWNFVTKSGLTKFRRGVSLVETCYQLCSTKVDDESVINRTVVGQLS